ncbi:hypothetical protein Q8F55_000689 [Vanrija albida]|uniref:SEC7 domain-containing protein n=1 Tax=Vanrija albida TaxID=181172 RepID=A0ABR3QE57_9TREE
MSSPPAQYAGPSPNAEIRSQAIAKLKRAASLPRTPDGRRQAEHKNGSAVAAPTVAVLADVPVGADDSTPSPTRLLNDYGDEELLSPSPGSAFPVDVSMQRSVSASSSYHIPTPPYAYGSATASPFYTAQPSPVAPGTDWAAYQLAQSYLPSISPAAPPSSFPAHLATPTGAGRNTPSPLPSLGDLRNLSRSNSAAARAKAMDKLTGGKSSVTPTRSTNVGTPLSSEEDVTLGEPGPARSLFRSGTIGVPRMFGLPNDQPATVDDAVVPSAPIPDTAFDVPRPRLQRSFTVSSSNMGEERRSAVGRRMVERLAERRQARQKEEAEVRNLWVERRRTRGLSTKIVDNTYDWDSNGSPGPELATPPPELPAAPTPPRQLGRELLAVPDRTPSRSTERSDGEAFEYESHLRRSLSSRTARDNVVEPSPEQLQENGSGEHLTPERLRATTPSREGTPLTQVYKGYASHHDPQDSSRDVSEDERAPASTHRRDVSTMSWEEVSGPEDREVPVDSRYLQKSTSVSSKMGRAITAIRKGSISRASSQATSPPTSPRGFPPSGPGRRPSDTSTRHSRSPSAVRESAHHNDRHLQSGAASPSPAEDANNLLIQHQLSSSGPVSFLPRATANDPRIHNSKLSPFPGIATFEQKQQHDNRHLQPVEPQSRVTSPQGAETTRSDSKRGWLRTLGGSTRSSNGSGSRTSQSDGQHSRQHSEDNRNGSMRIVNETPAAEEQDPFILSTPRADRTASPEANRSAPRGAHQEPGSQFLTNRRRAPPPPIEVTSSNSATIVEPTGHLVAPPGLSQTSTDVLNRMDNLLTVSGQDPAQANLLDDPPRKLLLAQQVLQVVNVNTVKDRYLLLFNDILVIAKPLMPSGHPTANLDMKFVVKSIVSLDKLVVSGIADEPTTEPPQHPAVQQFIKHFAEDPVQAVRQLVERSNPTIDSATLANLIFKTADLDKTQIGTLLATDEKLLLAFMDRFHFAEVPIDDALRMFLLSLRLPTDIAAAEALLRGFAKGYYKANQHIVSYDEVLAGDLVLAILELNDMLYSTFGFAFPNHAISKDTFISAFKIKDPRGVVSEEYLGAIYTSIRGSKLVQALASHEAYLRREVSVTKPQVTTKVTFGEWSEPIYVTIPKPDPALKIRLLGEGLEFNPPVLSFAGSHEESFTVRGVSLGTKSLLFDRIGATAAYYADIGNTRTFHVERAFMRHTFQVSFLSHLGMKRKYCFSVADAATRQRWASMLTRQVQLTTEAKHAGDESSVAARTRRAAETVSLHVLRDALIAPEEKAAPAKPIGSGANTPSRTARAGSVSIAYAAKAANEEAVLGPLHPTRGHHSDRQSGMVEVQTGKELILVCRQNSLLPGVLELLQSGTEPGAHRQAGANPNHLQQQPPLRSAGLKAMMHDRRL